MIRPKCPFCKKRVKVIPVKYGQYQSSRLEKKSQMGKQKFFYSKKVDTDPDWFCKSCDKYFGVLSIKEKTRHFFDNKNSSHIIERIVKTSTGITIFTYVKGKLSQVDENGKIYNV